MIVTVQAFTLDLDRPDQIRALRSIAETAVFIFDTESPEGRLAASILDQIVLTEPRPGVESPPL